MSSPEYRRIVDQYGKQLAPFSTTLVNELHQAAEAVAHLMTPDEMDQWAEEGLTLARQSWRSWEAAGEYFRVTPQVLPLLELPACRRWAQQGRELAEMSSSLGASYYRASPGTLAALTLTELPDWVALGRQLYKGTWRSASLAVQFFDGSPILFSHFTLEEARILVRFVDALCDRSYDLAAHCLSIAPQALTPLSGEDRGAFLRFAEALAATGWADARSYLEKGPGLLAHLHASQRVRFLRLARGLARQEGRQAFAFFAEAARAIGQIDMALHGFLLSLAEKLVARSPLAALEFLKTAPEVLSRTRIDDIEQWHQEGMQLLEANPKGGEAYFRLESSRAESVLESLSARVELQRIGHILRMYCKALTGTDVDMHPTDILAEKGIGWMGAEAPSTEGTSIYLPASVDEFEDKAENFSVYKVYSTHQAGHLEFGSFRFSFDGEGRVFPNLRRQMEQERADTSPPLGDQAEQPLTDMGRFLGLFQDRRLASDLFTILEDARVDAEVEREYGGILRAYHRIQERALEKRPVLEELPLLQAILENLVRASLGGLDHMRWPTSAAGLMGQLRQAIGIVQAMRQPGANVEDSAEATIRLYSLLEGIPNLLLEPMDEEWPALNEDGESQQSAPMDGNALGEETKLSPGRDVPYESPQSVDFRGDFKPELVQLLMRLREEHQNQPAPEGAALPVSPEQLKAMLEKSVEIAQDNVAEADPSQSSELFLANLTKELAQEQERAQVQTASVKDGQPVAGFSASDDQTELPAEPKYSYYDEWDFRAGDYKPRWCRVAEYAVAEGMPQFFDFTLSNYASLAAQTRRQFELLRPELFRKIKRLVDGEEFDLDSVVEFIVEREAGHTPPGKVYWRRNKVERDVSVAFLLDMSASTDEEIAKHERRQAHGEFDDDPRRYFSWWMARRAQELMSPPKRIIDLEKESIVLLIRALEAIGDIYGIYGFSGYGRENVEFYVVKDIDEPFSERIKRRIDKIAPVRSTRMGPAIRHAAAKLESCDSKVRILFLVSDGRPQDHGYGRDRTEKEYAIRDTHMALLEAKRKGLVPFCLTVDRYGHDYLKQMCADIGYAVVSDIESLPSKITTLYRRLTE